MNKFIIACIIFVVSGAASAEPAGCSPKPGKARWTIKTSIVAPVSSASFVDLSELLDRENPTLDDRQFSDLKTGRLPRIEGWPYKEGDMITTEGILDLVKCSRDDDDYHVQIRVREDASRCLIVEIPNGRYVHQRGLARQADAAREFIRNTFFDGKRPTGKLHDEATVRVTGQLFLDATHRQSENPGGGRGSGGCKATNLWEIHPVVKMEIIQ